MADDDATKPNENANGDSATAKEETGVLSTQPALAEHPSGTASLDPKKLKLVIVVASMLVGALAVSNVLLWTSLNSTKSELKTAQVKVNRLDSAAGSAFQDVADRVLAIETELGDVGSGSEDVSARVGDVEGALADLYSCVDDFLQGFDAANGGYFTYQFC